jgi:hypothetical protein
MGFQLLFFRDFAKFSLLYFFFNSVKSNPKSIVFPFVGSFNGFDPSFSGFTLGESFSSSISFPSNFSLFLLPFFRYFYGFSQLKTFFSLFKTLYRGFLRPYFVKFFMKGVGYRVWPLRSKAFYFRLGFTHRIIYYLPPGVSYKRRKYKFVLFSFDYSRLSQVAKHLLSLRVPDVYKGKGIRYVGDRVFTKSRLKDAKKR